jgi:hypothetical protein
MVRRLERTGATGLQLWFHHESLEHYLEQLQAMSTIMDREGWKS